MKLLRRLIIFIKKEERKAISLIKIVLKIAFSLFIICIIPIAYFLILISIEPRTFPEINNYIQNKILISSQDSIDINTKNATLSFDITSFNIVYNIKNFNKNKSPLSCQINNSNLIVPPKFAVEINPLKLIVGKIKIENIIISDFCINLNKFQNPNPIQEQNTLQTNLQTLHNTINDLHKDRFSIKKFKTRNIQLKSNNKLILKINSAEFHTETNNIMRSLETHYKINIQNNNIAKPVIIEGDCSILDNQDTNCNLNFFNLHPALLKTFVSQKNTLNNYLDKVNANFIGTMDISLNNYTQLHHGSFEIFSSKGTFSVKNILPNQSQFSNFAIKGKIDKNFENITTFLKTKINNAKLLMSMDWQKNKELTLNVDLSNASTQELKNLWPTFLNQKNIRKWVIEHIENGTLLSTRADLTMNITPDINLKIKDRIKLLNATTEFKNLDLNYSKRFSKISNLSGIANFSKNNMNIEIEQGKVYSTDIHSGSIAINNWFKKPVKLAINLKTTGPFTDLTNHIKHSKKEKIETITKKYINGKATSKITIAIPLGKKIKFQDIPLHIQSIVTNNNNEYLSNNSELKIEINKKNSDTINGQIDLRKSDFKIPVLGIKKYKNVPTDIIFKLKVPSNKSDIILSNVETKNSNIRLKGKGRISKTQGLKNFATSHLEYDNSNYNLYYNKLLSLNKTSNIITISGKTFDLKNILNNIANLKPTTKQKTANNSKPQTLVVNANFKQVLLKNKETLKNTQFVFKKESQQDLFTLTLDGKLNKTKKRITINIIPKKDRNKVKITYDDIGEIIHGLGISNKIIGGSGYINGYIFKHKNNNTIFKGEIGIRNEFDILTGSKFNRKFAEQLLQNKNLFKKTTKKILKHQKITFYKLKGKIILEKNILKVKDTALKSGMFGFGVTINGNVDMQNNTYNLSGLLIPVESLNDILGLSNLPIVGKIVFGQKDGALFAPKYTYVKNKNDKKGKFEIQAISAITPGPIRGLFEKLNIF